MDFNITRTRVSSDDFFKNLSKPDGRFFYGYEKGFEIDSKMGVTELSKRWFNPGRDHLEDDTKIITANNLKTLVSKNADDIVLGKIPGANATQIARVLERSLQSLTPAMQDPGKKSQVERSYQAAIKKLGDTHKKHALHNLKTGIDSKGKTEWKRKDFLRKMANTWVTGRPNFNMHLKLEGNGKIKPYTSRKLYWVEKFFYGKATSSLEKKAMMQNLEFLIQDKYGSIKREKLNTQGMEANIERLANRIKRNMTSSEQTEINQIVTRIKGRLQKAQVAIEKNAYLIEKIGYMVAGCLSSVVKWSALAPFRITKYVAVDIAITPLGKFTASIVYSLGAWATSPLAPYAKRASDVVFKGVKFVASYPIGFVKGAYTEVISPTIEVAGILAKAPFDLGKQAVAAINSMRQVTA